MLFMRVSVCTFLCVFWLAPADAALIPYFNDFNAVAKVRLDNAKYGSAVMLSDKVGLTAANLFNNKQWVEIEVGGIKQTITKQNWEFALGYKPGGTTAQNNLVLFRLEDPVEGLSDVKIYRRKNELKKRLTYVGYESSRALGGGITKFRNVFDNYGGHNLTDEDQLAFDLDVRELDGSIRSTTGNAKRLKNEGIFKKREAGGAAFIKTKKGGWRLAGIGSFQTKMHPGNNEYTEVASFARVSRYADWIDGYLAPIQLPTKFKEYQAEDILGHPTLVVPEPTSLGLVFIGLVTLGIRRLSNRVA